MKSIIWPLLASALVPATAMAAPDEEKLGKSKGYPAGSADNWFYDESVRVGSFTAQGEIPGIMHGKSNILEPSPKPMPLPRRLRDYEVEDYLARNRVMGLMIVRDGVVELERYQYDRTATHRFTSNSIANRSHRSRSASRFAKAKSVRSTTARKTMRRSWREPPMATRRSAISCA